MTLHNRAIPLTDVTKKRREKCKIPISFPGRLFVRTLCKTIHFPYFIAILCEWFSNFPILPLPTSQQPTHSNHTTCL